MSGASESNRQTPAELPVWPAVIRRAAVGNSRRHRTLLGWLLAGSAGLAVIACTSSSYKEVEGVETASAVVAMEEIPAAVRKTFLEQAGKNQIRELERKVVGGETVYEAAWLTDDGFEIEAVVAPSGRLLRTKGGPDPVAASPETEAGWRDTFDVDTKNLETIGRNRYFQLVPGFRIHLTDGHTSVVISVQEETEVIDGIETRVVEEHETTGGELTEISRNYFAIDRTNGDVYYFGENVVIYEAGEVVSHDGAWLSGVNGAKFGLALPGRPVVGDKYYQEVAAGQAMDRAEVVELDATLETPLETFAGVLTTQESTPLEPGEVSHKWYAPGIGMIGDDRLRVVKIEER